MHRKDVELGGPVDETVDSLNRAEYCRIICFALVLILVMYVTPNALHYLWYGEFHPQATDAGRLLEHSSILHSIVSHMGSDSTSKPTAISPYRKYTARVFRTIADVPDVMREPCRDITHAELLAGLLLEDYEIPLLLMRMCEVVHELVGCEESGYIIPKLLETPNDLNVCILTYKEASGVCSHYINSVGRPLTDSSRPLTGADMVSIQYDDPFYAYKDKRWRDLYSSYQVSYQPIVEEQVLRDEQGDAATQELSDSYKQIERAFAKGWLPVVPKRTTVTLGRPESFYYQIADSLLYGTDDDGV